MKRLGLASKRHPLKTQGFTHMAQATHSIQAKPILCTERIPMVRSRVLTHTTSKRALLFLAHSALFKRFLPNTPPLIQVNQQDSAPSRLRATIPSRRLNKPRAQEQSMQPIPGKDRTLGIPQVSPPSSTRKKHHNPTAIRTTPPQVGATKQPAHKQLHLRISSHSLPPRSMRANALKHGHAWSLLSRS